MAAFANAVEGLIRALQHNLPVVLMLLAILWLFNGINWLVGSPLCYLGIYPRRWLGLVGIPLAPLLHANVQHLFFNSIPLVILVDMLLLYGWPSLIRVTVFIVLVGGLALWVVGRRAIHIGASSLIMGYWGYLLAQAYYVPSVVSWVLALVMLYYLGSLIFGLFPTETDVSWEGHLTGFLAGLAAAWYYAL